MLCVCVCVCERERQREKERFEANLQLEEKTEHGNEKVKNGWRETTAHSHTRRRKRRSTLEEMLERNVCVRVLLIRMCQTCYV